MTKNELEIGSASLTNIRIIIKKREREREYIFLFKIENHLMSCTACHAPLEKKKKKAKRV